MKFKTFILLGVETQRVIQRVSLMGPNAYSFYLVRALLIRS